MKRVLVVGAICTVVSACNTAQGTNPATTGSDLKAQPQMAEAAFLQAEQDCQAKRFRTQSEYAECMNEAESRIKGPFMFSNRDLLDVKLATRTALAKRIDRGQITAAKASLELAETIAQLEAEIARRASAQSPAKAQ